MGVNNRQRRRAKKQQREQRERRAGRAPHGSGSVPPPPLPPPPPSDADLIRHGVLMAAEAFRFQDPARFDHAFQRLCGLRDRVGFGAVDEAVTWWVGLALDRLWNEGWQPADVIRALERKLGAEPAGSVTDRVVASAAARSESTADRRWAAQLDALRAGPPRPSASGGGVPGWERGLQAAVRAVSLLLYLPALPSLGRSSGGSGRSAKASAVLERVRALLAKAESTSFEEEADAFTAKAQELMARHAIDDAMVAVGDREAGATEVVGWRIPVDDPYASPKSLLLHAIARANRCQAVYCADLGFATVFGAESDLEVVELLFTSLLVQATDAMVRAGRAVDRSGRSRTRSYRQSFLVAFAVRIGERLAAVDREVIAEGQERYGDALLPVLASRSQAVDDSVERAFPRMVRKGVSVNNAAGYVAGRAAAEVASLSVGEALPASP